jgi:hypothetical protein
MNKKTKRRMIQVHPKYRLIYRWKEKEEEKRKEIYSERERKKTMYDVIYKMNRRD